MAYVDQKHGKEKGVAAVITAILFVIFGYAFYTGLAFNVIKKVAKDMKVIDVNTPPPPPPKKPPPPPKETPKPQTPPPVVAPPPIVQPPIQAPPIIATVTHAPPPVITPTAPPAPPAPPAPKPSQAVGAKPRGNPGDWVTTDDYPPGAIRNGEKGRTGFKLDIGTDGRVTNCTVTSSSGFSDLDQTACRQLQRRGRFSPAKDTAGNAIATSYTSSVLWQLPAE